MPITLTGEVSRVTYENEESGFRVVKLERVEGADLKPGEVLAVVGRFVAVGPGTRVRVTGDLVEDPKHGRQLKAESLVPLAPSTLAGLEKYLGSGAIAGIGPGFAKRIVGRFGLQSLEILDQAPDRLAEIPGIGQARIDGIKRSWSSQRAISNIMLLLESHGASPALALRIFRHYGDRAAAIVQRSPYRLELEVRGVGFKTADRIAQSLGISGDHPERAQAGVLHVLESHTERGHVLVLREALVAQSAEVLGIQAPHVEAAIDALWAAGRVVVEGQPVFPVRLHRAECQVAEAVADLVHSPGHALPGAEAAMSEFERRAGIELAPNQRQAVAAAAAHKLVVITGGPGVGKTTIVRAMLSVFTQAHQRVQLAAPTGRAAKRLSEATGQTATTIHRLLEFEPRTGRFQRNAEAPVDADAIIVDESSMIDLPLAAALFAAIPPAARVVVVGDADQLPSVGPGAFLRDLLDSGVVASVRLDQVFRQAAESGIVSNAHSIHAGQVPRGAEAGKELGDFYVIDRRDAEQAAEVVCELVVRRIPQRFGFDPRTEIQVLAPMHRGPAGTQALNRRLQAALNPGGRGIEHQGQTLRVGDKVMQVRNDYEREVFNGDIGFVREIDDDEHRVVIDYDGRPVSYEQADLDAIILAYATSVHKSQGSEYPAVVVPLLTTHFMMLSKNLLYTAVTRARKLCVLVADPRALRLAVSDARAEPRLTSLSDRIRRAHAGA